MKLKNNNNEWQKTRLKNIADVNIISLAASTPPDFLMRYLEISNVNYHGIISHENIRNIQFADAPSRARRIVNDGDTLISSVRPNLQAIAYIDETKDNFIASTGFNIVSPYKSQLFNKYIYYLLISEGSKQYFEATAKGVGYPAIDEKDFLALSIILPSFKEQKRITAFLDKTCASIDAAIEIKRKQLDNLDALRKSIIHKAVTRGLNDSIDSKDSGVGWIGKKPKHWLTCRIKDVIVFYNTMRVPLSANERGLMDQKIYDYYGASGIIDKVENYIFDGTYILIAEDGANLIMRNSPLAFKASGKFWVNNHAHILKPRFGNIDYFIRLLESLDYSLYVTGAAQPKLTKENLGRYKIIVPPIKEQGKIADYLDFKINEIIKLRHNLTTQIFTLENYRKSLIHECVTGKRRITEDDLKDG